MAWLSSLARRIQMLLGRTRFDSDLEEEMRLHVELRERQHMADGVSPGEARDAARRRFGNITQLKEVSRDMWGWQSIDHLSQDVRHGVRQLRRSPGFTSVAVITLALGSGANTAIFTLVHQVMLKSLPVSNPGQLYRLGDNNNCCVMFGLQGSFVLYSFPLYQQLRDHTPEFVELAAFQPILTNLSVRRREASGPAQPYMGQFVSGNYFTMFGSGRFSGRAITAADDTPGAPPVAVVSYHTWRDRFGLDPTVIGATFNMNQVPYTVVGVAPPGFYGDMLRSDPPDFWLPLAAEPALARQNSLLMNPGGLQWLYAVGRLKPGVAPAQVESRLTVELQQWLSSRRDLEARDRANIAKQFVRLTPAGGGAGSLQDDYAAGLRLLMAVSGLVLLIACANIANLLLARGVAARSQSALRIALGATRTRLIRQTLTESVLLSIAGGTAGLAVAFAGTRTILLVAFRGARYVPISPNPSLTVLGFAFLLSLATGIVFGVAPAWIASHSDPAEALRAADRSTGHRSSLPRRALVVVQVALSLVLVAGAGLLTQSLRNLENQRFGFETRGRLMVRVQPALAGYSAEQLHGLYHQLRERLSRIPGVLSASLSFYSPMQGNNWSQRVFIEGHPPGEEVYSSLDRVSGQYFETIGTRLLRGRPMGEEDTSSTRPSAVVNQTFATRFFPNEDPIGQRLGLGDARRSGDYEIVGIVEDAKYLDMRGPAYATVFLPLLPTWSSTKEPRKTADPSSYISDVELRVAGTPESLGSDVRRTIAGIDPNLTVLDMMSFDEQLARNLNQERLIARLTTLFGFLALAVASVGLYGVTAYTVSRRTNEIGVRMALGADRSSVFAMVLRGAMSQIALGLVIGIPVALAAGRMVSSQLYGVKVNNPVVLASAGVVLVLCGLVAAFVPARRAALLDPTVALRTE